MGVLVPRKRHLAKRLGALSLGFAVAACDAGATPQQLTRIGARIKAELAVNCTVMSAKRDGQLVVTVYLRDLPPALPGTLHPKVEDAVVAEAPDVDRVIVLARVRGDYRPVF